MARGRREDRPAPEDAHRRAAPDRRRSIPQKRGVPAVAVVGILIAIVSPSAAAAIAFFALRNSGTLTAVPQLDENGRESLKIGCTSCPDGTNVSLGASSRHGDRRRGASFRSRRRSRSATTISR